LLQVRLCIRHMRYDDAAPHTLAKPGARFAGKARWPMEIAVVSWLVDHEETRGLLERYVARLDLPTDRLRVTTERREFEGWLGRRVRSSIGGAYTFVAASGEHLILINLPRIDQSRPRSLEVVVAEELLHMRDRLDGDLRRHAKHGYDRIAHRVSALTGATLEEIRASLVAPTRRAPRYLYWCPCCGVRVPRQKQGTWSCGRCAPRFDPRFMLRLHAASGV
jgi:predicted SprT family Zn-dependent metalloprotease